MSTRNRMGRRPLVVAHRGASEDAPENTLAAFKLAWQQGADAIEVDCYLALDRQIVCIHDETALRTAGVDLAIAQSTSEALRRLDAGIWKGSQWAGERIPFLADVLATVPAGKQVYVELKSGVDIFEPLAAALRQSGLLPEQTILIAFDAGLLKQAKAAFPDRKRLWVTDLLLEKDRVRLMPSPETILATLRDIDADGVDCRADSALDAAFLNALRRGKREVHVWYDGVIPNPEFFRELGVDSITNNRVRLFASET